jgi:hypothetical protein
MAAPSGLPTRSRSAVIDAGYGTDAEVNDSVVTCAGGELGRGVVARVDAAYVHGGEDVC